MKSTMTTRPDGTREWRNEKGELHRDGDLPAVQFLDGSLEYYAEGKRHREGDRPAVVQAGGLRIFWQKGKRFREGGKPVYVFQDDVMIAARGCTMFASLCLTAEECLSLAGMLQTADVYEGRAIARSLEHIAASKILSASRRASNKKTSQKETQMNHKVRFTLRALLLAGALLSISACREVESVSLEDVSSYVSASIISGDTAVLETALKEGFAPNTRGANGLLPLVVAVVSGNEGALTRLLSAGADTSLLCQLGAFEGVSPVCAAIGVQSLSALDALLEGGADPEGACIVLRGGEVLTPLDFSVMRGRGYAATLLCVYGADPHKKLASGLSACEYSKSGKLAGFRCE
jgi:hypothetical protein